MNLNDKSQFPKLSGIYKITNLINNKSYIGSAVNLKLRLQNHYYELNKGTHSNKYLLRSFNKYGEDNFNVEIIEIFEKIDYKLLLKLEKEYIIYFDTLNSGYNLILDNSSFFVKMNKSKKHIDENKKRQSIPVYAININNNKIEYEFESVSEASLFFKTSSSNISRVCKGLLNYIKGYNFCYQSEYDKNKNYRKNLTRKGIKLSENHKNNLKVSNQKRLGKNTFKYDLDLNLIEVYPSRSSAEDKNNLNKESLRSRIDKRTPFEGFYWSSKEIKDIVQTLQKYKEISYQYTRAALWMVLEELEKCFETLIILAHLKDKLLEKEGKEMTERGIDLIGKSAAILSANVDAIGYMYRDDNQTIVNFKPSESVTCGSRCDHLKDQKVVLIESDESGKLTVDWSKIFIKE